MSRSPITHIDSSRCTGCGKCVRVCPADTLSIVDKKAKVTGQRSMQCGQCVAICPENAVHLDDIGPVVLETITTPDTLELLSVIQKRRSCRCYTAEPVDPQILEDLIRLGICAPSGTNAQRWRFTVIPDRASMLQFANEVLRFYLKINKLAANPVLRTLTKPFMKDALGGYYRRYYSQVKQAIDDFHRDGTDKLFHGAVSAILVSAQGRSGTPAEDTLLATQNILLGAETIGLGTCLIGFAVEAMKRDAAIGRSVNIPDDETVYSVIALGHPAVTYQRPSGRRPPVIRYATK